MPPAIAAISPFFIVRNVTTATAFYREMLGFAIEHQYPDQDPFFAIVTRDSAMIFLKSVGEDPLPNVMRHPDARWDAYLSVPDPDALASEFSSRGVTFSMPMNDSQEGLRGFEIEDADGYILFFGRPREISN